MKWLHLSGLFALAATTASAHSVFACGGGGVTSKSGVLMDSQRIVISLRPTTTEIIAQVSVPTTTADYGVLIPVPSQPTLDKQPVSARDLQALDNATAPQIYRATSGGDSGDSGCGCLAAGNDDDAAASPMPRVSASAPVDIGPVTAVVLTGDNADDVEAWLSDNGFALPEAEAPTLAAYVAHGNYFIAIRRNDHAAPGGPTSVGIHYTLVGDHRKLSLGFARIGAAASVAFTVFIIAPTAIGPSAPFAALTLNDLPATPLRNDDYSAALKQAVAEHGGQAFVLESALTKRTLANSVSLLQSLEDDAVITRLSTIISREDLAEDVVFAAPFTSPVPRQRYASFSLPHGRYASFGAVGALIVGALLRRRTRAPRPS
ncbi:MAG: DUF2330 domain-containing protein [Pseudomonadota bacterium]